MIHKLLIRDKDKDAESHHTDTDIELHIQIDLWILHESFFMPLPTQSTAWCSTRTPDNSISWSINMASCQLQCCLAELTDQWLWLWSTWGHSQLMPETNRQTDRQTEREMSVTTVWVWSSLKTTVNIQGLKQNSKHEAILSPRRRIYDGL